MIISLHFLISLSYNWEVISNMPEVLTTSPNTLMYLKVHQNTPVCIIFSTFNNWTKQYLHLWQFFCNLNFHKHLPTPPTPPPKKILHHYIFCISTGHLARIWKVGIQNVLWGLLKWTIWKIKQLKDFVQKGHIHHSKGDIHVHPFCTKFFNFLYKVTVPRTPLWLSWGIWTAVSCKMYYLSFLPCCSLWPLHCL